MAYYRRAGNKSAFLDPLILFEYLPDVFGHGCTFRVFPCLNIPGYRTPPYHAFTLEDQVFQVVQIHLIIENQGGAGTALPTKDRGEAFIQEFDVLAHD